MPAFALNHMTVASAGFRQMLELAQQLGCVGVECRNDLSGPLFDGYSPTQAAKMLRDAGLRLLSLAEIKRFDRLTEAVLRDAISLMDSAADVGAEAVSLIPNNDGSLFDEAAFVESLELLQPHLQQRGLTGLIEPLGFETCGLRFKKTAIDILEKHDHLTVFQLIHDTFHHHLAGEVDLFAQQTGLVHLSGVTERGLEASQMRDSHRLLVDQDDRLGNVTQIIQLLNAGYSGLMSFEAFAPALHRDPNNVEMIRNSMNYIDAALSQEAA